MINVTNGAPGSHAGDDIKRTLSQIFGDGKGAYPHGTYLNMLLLHSISGMADVEAVYEGYDRPDPKAETIGALAALIDYRDGTNLTGLNPKEEKLIRSIPEWEMRRQWNETTMGVHDFTMGVHDFHDFR